MRWNRSLPALAGALALLGCSSPAKQGAAGTNAGALANADRDLSDTVRSLLSAYEAVPGRESWLKLEGDVPAVLEQIATDSGELLSRRARALEVLGWYGERGVPLLRNVLGDGSTPPAVRMGAVTGVARALPPADAVPLLTRSLADADPMVRFRSVLELKHIALPQARAALEARAKVETDGSVNRALRDALASEQPSLPTPGTNMPTTTP